MNTNVMSGIFALLAGSSAGLLGQQPPGTQLWMYEAGAGHLIQGSPAVSSDGTVYFSVLGNLYAITNGGSNKWSFPLQTGGDNVYSSPAIGSDGTIYVASGELYAINPDGSQKWTYPAGAGDGSPAIGPDNTIYVDGYSYLHAVSPYGTNIWKHVIPNGSTFCAPALAPDGGIYIASRENNTFYGLNPDGTEKWTFPAAVTPGESAAIAANGNVYMTGGALYAFTPDGTNLWRNQTNGFIAGSPAVGKDGTIYIGNTALALCAFSPDGVLKWRAVTNLNAPYDTPGKAPAIDSSGMLYYAAFDSLFGITPAGEVQWTFSTHGSAGDLNTYTWTCPTIGPDGTIYATFGTKLYAIAGTNKLGDTPWPMFRQNARHTGKLEKPSLQKPQKRADTSFQFELYAQLGETNTVQASPDLSNWTPLADIVITNVPTDFIDTDASNFPSRYYRALGPPPP